MCLLSLYPPEVLPDMEKLTAAAKNNPHGFGYGIVTTHQGLLVGRGMDATVVLEQFEAARAAHPEGAALFHCRWATSGTRNEFNCHPFPVGRDRRTVLAHNGILFRPAVAEPRSDTHMFAAEIMPTQYRAIDRPGVRARLEKALTGSKVVVLTVNRKYRHQYYIFNESAGNWLDDGSWQSNDSWKPRRTYTTTYMGKGHWEEGPDKVKRYVYDTNAPASNGDKALVPYKPAVVNKTGSHYGWCKYCYTPQVVEPWTKQCTQCHTCNDCGRYFRHCDCALTGIPSR